MCKTYLQNRGLDPLSDFGFPAANPTERTFISWENRFQENFTQKQSTSTTFIFRLGRHKKQDR